MDHRTLISNVLDNIPKKSKESKEMIDLVSSDDEQNEMDKPKKSRATPMRYDEFDGKPLVFDDAYVPETPPPPSDDDEEPFTDIPSTPPPKEARPFPPIPGLSIVLKPRKEWKGNWKETMTFHVYTKQDISKGTTFPYPHPNLPMHGSKLLPAIILEMSRTARSPSDFIDQLAIEKKDVLYLADKLNKQVEDELELIEHTTNRSIANLERKGARVEALCDIPKRSLLLFLS